MTKSGTINADFSGRLGGFELDARFSVPAQGITALYGPSGCGKTSVLRCMAGLSHIAGTLSIDGEVWQDSAQNIFHNTHQRDIGYVFQEASLFSHLSVRDNLLYGARRSKNNTTSVHAGFDQIVTLLNIGHLQTRAPDALSGGERQRVAVGRALLSRPRILLMDEPLSALDQFSKNDILPYFEALHEELAIPVIYVSHDMREVERLADTLVLMDKGRVTGTGPLSDMQANPAMPLLEAPDAAVTLDGIVESRDEPYALTRFSISGGHLIASGLQGATGEHKRLRIAASDVSFTNTAPRDTTILNILPAVVQSIQPHGAGPQVDVIVSLGQDGSGAQIIGRITRKSLDNLALREGSPVYAQIKGVAIASSGSAQRFKPG